MSVSETIRVLAREGLTTAEIARRLRIRYQHPYNVLKAGGELAASGTVTGATVDRSRSLATSIHAVIGCTENPSALLNANPVKLLALAAIGGHVQ